MPAIYFVFGHDGSPQGFTAPSPPSQESDSVSSFTSAPPSESQTVSEIAAKFKESLLSQKQKRRLKSPLEARFQIFPGPRSFNEIVQFASGFAARERKVVTPSTSATVVETSSSSTPSQTATDVFESQISSAVTTTGSVPSQLPESPPVHDEL